MEPSIETLKRAAERAAANAWNPYSRFGVGVALATGKGEVITGCNVENASYGLTICAERNALFAAIARGYRRDDFRRLLIYTPGERLYTSCGACRQVMVELMPPGAQLIHTCDGGEVRQMTVADCLPDAFSLQP